MQQPESGELFGEWDNRGLSPIIAAAPGLQALAYRYDPVGNILGLRNTLAVPPPRQYGGPSQQTFVYDDLYRLTQADGVYRTAPHKPGPTGSNLPTTASTTS